ncbi:MAG: hypothetical protein ACK5Y2_06550 [Bdellovibrionales bacterium]
MMIFFREHQARIELQKKPETGSRAFFARLRAHFHGKPEALSGMILNLKDVDEAMKALLGKGLKGATFREILEQVSTSLLRAFPNHFDSLTLHASTFSLTLRKGQFVACYPLIVRLGSSRKWTERRLILGTTKPLRAPWRREFQQRSWESFDDCVMFLKKLKGPVINAQMERLEQGGWEQCLWESSDNVSRALAYGSSGFRT